MENIIMKTKFLYVVLIAISGVGLLAGVARVEPIPEPAIMFLFGTGLVGVAGIIKKEND
jgi:hypothetical protein